MLVSAEENQLNLNVGSTFPDGKVITHNTSYKLAKGVMENEVISNTIECNKQSIGYFISADIADKKNNIKIAAGYPGYDASKYNLATVIDQAKDYENAHSGEKVIAAINADFFTMDTEEAGKTRGPVVMDGILYQGNGKRNFFAILNDGTAVICNGNRVIQNGKRKGERVKLDKDVMQAVGGDLILAKNGKLTRKAENEYAQRNYSRATIGIKEDGSVVTYVTKGNIVPISCGETYEDTANKLLAVGCTTVLALDGGGSATSASKRKDDSKLEVHNAPSDGAPRQVASTLFIVSTDNESSSEDIETESHIHDYLYDPYMDTAVCNSCGNTSSEVIGFVHDSEKNQYYLINGNPIKGWKAIGEEMFYFDKNGIMQKTVIQGQKKLECNSNGYKIYFCDRADKEDGKVYRVASALNAPGHDYDENYVCKKCGWKIVDIKDCEIKTNYSRYRYTGQEIKPKVTISYNGKILNSFYDYSVSYEDNVDVGSASIKIDTNKRRYVDLTEVRGSILPTEFEKNFTIVPKSVSGLKAITNGSNSVKLTWNKSDNIDGFAVYKYSASNKNYSLYKFVNSDARSCIVKNLKAGYLYSFKVNTYALDKEGEKILSARKTASCITKPYRVGGVNLKALNKAFIVKWNKCTCTGYQIMYSSDKTFKKRSIFTVKESINNSKKISRLYSHKRYYVKVRAYRAFKNKATVYGAWSTVKSVFTK